jgi:hypothetical protein
VPPGRYLLRARGDGDTPQFATQPLSVDGGDVGDLTVVLSAGATLTGTVTFQPGSSQVPEITQVRIGAPTTDQTAFGPQANARVDKDGRFTLSGVSTGPHLIRPNGNMRGWSLKSVTLDGRDITDTPIEVRAGQTLSNVAIRLHRQSHGSERHDHHRIGHADAGLHGVGLPHRHRRCGGRRRGRS